MANILGRTRVDAGVMGHFFEVVQYQAAELARRAIGCLPGFRMLIDRPGLQPLRSSHLQLYRWWRAPYGSAGKPASLDNIPWDYVREYEDRIPFLGLREYWYPALESRELRHNEAKGVTIAGDEIVLFRDADGTVRALQNHCPLRGVLLSLGQVGVVEPGTITCRYHGLTLDGEGRCIAIIADGPDSPACRKIQARTYPTDEVGGIIWTYMGQEKPKPVLDAVPHARQVLDESAIVIPVHYPFSHLNALDNSIDLAHPNCLHRNCVFFASQKLWGRITVSDEPCGGVKAVYSDDNPHPGMFYVNEIDWHLPNMAYFPPGSFSGVELENYFWAVPKGVGDTEGWFILRPLGPHWRRILMQAVWPLLEGRRIPWPGGFVTCVDGGDAPMMKSQGRIADWSRDTLLRTDASVIRARTKLQEAHARERAAAAKGAAY